MRIHVLAGCIITAALFPAAVFAHTPKPSFGKDIAPILYAKCAMCHQAWRGGADVAYDVQRSAAMGPRDQSPRSSLTRCRLGTPTESPANGVTIAA